MNSPIYLEWAAGQPPREARPAPPAGRGRPLLALAGLIALVASLVAVWQELEPLVTFRPVTATIVTSEAARDGIGRSSGTARSLAARRTRLGRATEIDYRYTVDGLECFGASYRRPEWLGLRRDATREIAELPPGRTLDAWYNPWQPGDAVLDRTPNRWGLAILALVACLGAWLVRVASPPRAAAERTPEIDDALPLRKSA